MVIKYLSQGEAFKVAMNLEKEGRDFYEEFARKTKDEDIRHIFLQLAEEEQEHYNMFRKMYEQSGEANKEILGEDEEVRKYLASLVRPGVFYDVRTIPQETLKGLDVAEALGVGVQVEKDSIIFYTEAWLRSRNIKAKKAFKTILAEERRHLNILIERMLTLGKIKRKR